MIESILAGIVASSGFSIFFVWLLKLGLEAKVDAVKLDLENKHAVERMELQAQIDRAAMSLQIKSGGIFETRVRFLLRYFEQLNKVNGLATELQHSIDAAKYGKAPHNKVAYKFSYKAMSDSLQEAYTLYQDNRPLISEKLDDLSLNLFQDFFIARSGLDQMLHEYTENNAGKFERFIDERRDKLHSASSKLIRELLPEFRFLIGTSGKHDEDPDNQ